MKTLFSQVVFSVGSKRYCWDDVVLGAKLRGDWADLENRLRQGIACLKRMEDTGDSPSTEEVESAAEEFRYEHDLLTAQETEAWLEQWGLTTETWMEYIQRSVLRQRWSDQLEDIVSQHSASDEEIDRQVKCEGICSGELARFAHKLAARAAVYEKNQEEASSEARKETAGEPLGATLQASLLDIEEYRLPGISRESCQEKLKTLSSLEGYFQFFSKQVLTPKAIKDQINSHRLDWTKLDCLQVLFPDEQMAREAALCVREDGKELAEVAAEAKTEVQEACFFLDQAVPEWRDHFLGAQKGELVGPLKSEEGFALFLVRDKIMASMEDPDVRQLAEQAVLERAIDHEVNNRVKWHSRL